MTDDINQNAKRQAKESLSPPQPVKHYRRVLPTRHVSERSPSEDQATASASPREEEEEIQEHGDPDSDSHPADSDGDASDIFQSSDAQDEMLSTESLRQPSHDSRHNSDDRTEDDESD